MSTLQEIFNNREIAVSFWVSIAIFAVLFTKAGKQFIKSVIPTVFCKKFVKFYIVFLSFFSLTIYVLYQIGFWNISLLKDTFFWVLFVEVPLFIKAIEQAKDSRFFAKLIKDNLKVILIFEFIINFWTFDLVWEFILVPVSVVFAFLYVLTSRDKQYKAVKNLFDIIIGVFGIYVIFFTIKNIITTPSELINMTTAKVFILPTLLLFLNLPVVYGLALFNVYEQVFIRLKGTYAEQRKMKRRLLLFAKFNLSRISALRNDCIRVLVTSLTDNDMKINLEKFEKYLDNRVGDNYMKRANYYKIWCIVGGITSLVGLIACNSYVGIKDIFSLNFVLDIDRIKEIVTYICSSGIVISLFLFIYTLGYKKKKYEEISQIKKFALHGFLFTLKHQFNFINECIPVDEPKELFYRYIKPALELNSESQTITASYDNLLNHWELETVKQLNLYSLTFLQNICTDRNTLSNMDHDDFVTYYIQQKDKSPQSEKINVFIYDVSKAGEKYIEQVKLCYDELKKYY